MDSFSSLANMPQGPSPKTPSLCHCFIRQPQGPQAGSRGSHQQLLLPSTSWEHPRTGSTPRVQQPPLPTGQEGAAPLCSPSGGSPEGEDKPCNSLQHREGLNKVLNKLLALIRR